MREFRPEMREPVSKFFDGGKLCIRGKTECGKCSDNQILFCFKKWMPKCQRRQKNLGLPIDKYIPKKSEPEQTDDEQKESKTIITPEQTSPEQNNGGLKILQAELEAKKSEIEELKQEIERLKTEQPVVSGDEQERLKAEIEQVKKERDALAQQLHKLELDKSKKIAPPPTPPAKTTSPKKEIVIGGIIDGTKK